MAVEWELFRERRTDIVLIKGVHGCGKTTFSQWLMRWWLITGVVTRYYGFSYKSREKTNILLLLRKLYDRSQPDYPKLLDSFV